jgi:hypothetical protein
MGQNRQQQWVEYLKAHEAWKRFRDVSKETKREYYTKRDAFFKDISQTDIIVIENRVLGNRLDEVTKTRPERPEKITWQAFFGGVALLGAGPAIVGGISGMWALIILATSLAAIVGFGVAIVGFLIISGLIGLAVGALLNRREWKQQCLVCDQDNRELEAFLAMQRKYGFGQAGPGQRPEAAEVAEGVEMEVITSVTTLMSRYSLLFNPDASMKSGQQESIQIGHGDQCTLG